MQSPSLSTERKDTGAWLFESLQWNLLPGLILDLPLLSVGSLLILRSKRTPVPAATSHSYWNFMSCPRSSSVRRPNLHRPLRLIANLWKKCWCRWNRGGLFHYSVPCYAFANAFHLWSAKINAVCFLVVHEGAHRKRPHSRVGESENTEGTTSRQEVVTKTQYFLLNAVLWISLFPLFIPTELELCVLSN